MSGSDTPASASRRLMWWIVIACAVAAAVVAVVVTTARPTPTRDPMTALHECQDQIRDKVKPRTAVFEGNPTAEGGGGSAVLVGDYYARDDKSGIVSPNGKYRCVVADSGSGYHVTSSSVAWS